MCSIVVVLEGTYQAYIIKNAEEERSEMHCHDNPGGVGCTVDRKVYLWKPPNILRCWTWRPIDDWVEWLRGREVLLWLKKKKSWVWEWDRQFTREECFIKNCAWFLVLQQSDRHSMTGWMLSVLFRIALGEVAERHTNESWQTSRRPPRLKNRTNTFVLEIGSKSEASNQQIAVINTTSLLRNHFFAPLASSSSLDYIPMIYRFFSNFNSSSHLLGRHKGGPNSKHLELSIQDGISLATSPNSFFTVQHNARNFIAAQHPRYCGNGKLFPIRTNLKVSA